MVTVAGHQLRIGTVDLGTGNHGYPDSCALWFHEAVPSDIPLGEPVY